MSEKKIQVELTEAQIRGLAKAARFTGSKMVGTGLQDAIDALEGALPPEYPEGTVAWVTSRAYADHRYIAIWDGEKWVEQIGGIVIAMPSQIAKVEPLRVLADDEIAVKRPSPSDFDDSDLLRLAEFAAARFPYTTHWLRDVLAPALEADS